MTRLVIAGLAVVVAVPVAAWVALGWWLEHGPPPRDPWADDWLVGDYHRVPEDDR